MTELVSKPAIHIDPEEYEKILECVHCGLCISDCPTYRELGVEADSPRGRLYLMKAAADGRISLSDDFVGHMYLCLNCRNCEAVCPSGVKFGMLMEKTRDEIEVRYPRPFIYKALRKIILEGIFPHSSRIGFVLSLLRFYQTSRLRDFIQKLGLLRALPGKLADLEEISPAIPPNFFRPSVEVVEPLGKRRYRVGFFSGCIMSTVYGPVDEASVRVLSRNGCQVVIPKQQECCGAVHAHNGDTRTAARLARQNIDTFLRADVDFVIINSAGCGALLKEYDDLLKHDVEYSHKAGIFSGKVRDIIEFLPEIGINTDFGRLNMRVTYQDPCHLVHAQRISTQPRELISAIPGIELVEMTDSTQCCGAAGIYNITNYDMSMTLLDGKIENIRNTGADAIVTANPPCLIQMDLGNRRGALGVKVMHLAELLDMAYRSNKSGN